MTREEAIQLFNPCCGSDLIMNSTQCGKPRLYCQVCGFTIRQNPEGWVITKWGVVDPQVHRASHPE